MMHIVKNAKAVTIGEPILMTPQQAQQVLFPPCTLVYVYSTNPRVYTSTQLVANKDLLQKHKFKKRQKHGHNQASHYQDQDLIDVGKVTRVHLHAEGHTHLLYTVRSSETKLDMIVKESQLRFCNGCKVNVKSLKDETLWIPGVVVGRPEIMSGHSDGDGSDKSENEDKSQARAVSGSFQYRYVYFVKLLHGDGHTDGDEVMPEIIDVTPERVRFRMTEESASDSLFNLEPKPTVQVAEQMSERGIVTEPMFREEDASPFEKEIKVKAITEELDKFRSTIPSMYYDRDNQDGDYTFRPPLPRTPSSPNSVANSMRNHHNSTSPELENSNANGVDVNEILHRMSLCVSNLVSRPVDTFTCIKKNTDGNNNRFHPHRSSSSIGSLQDRHQRKATGFSSSPFSRKGKGAKRKAVALLKPKPTSTREQISTPSHWRGTVPEESESHEKVVNGVLHSWREGYNGGKVNWSEIRVQQDPTTITTSIPDTSSMDDEELCRVMHGDDTLFQRNYEKVRKETNVRRSTNTRISIRQIRNKTCILVRH